MKGDAMTVDLAVGAVLDGKYRVERQLGSGGMGAVYLATHLGTTRPVALKVIVPHLAGHEEFFARFRREAEAAGRLRHPNVINVTDFGVAARPGAAAGDRDGEIAYLVMEYLGGPTLAEYLAATPRPPLEVVVDVVDQVALALDAAHALGVVHRDLKPENILLESNRRGGFNAKVLDFGVAKLSEPGAEPSPAAPRGAPAPAPTLVADPSGTVVLRAPDVAGAATLAAVPETTDTLVLAGALAGATAATGAYATLAGSLVGTPAYMSPEQCRGEAVDGRSDVYSLAVIAYQMLSGEVPFAGRTTPETLRMQIADAPAPLEARAPTVAPALATVVLEGLAKDPARRPATAGLFAARVRIGAEGEARALRQSKDIVNNHVALFIPLLAAAMLLPVLGLAGARLLLLATVPLLELPPAVVIAGAVLLSAGFVHLGAQLYDAVMVLALSEFVAARRYRLRPRRLLAGLARLLPRLALTKLRALPRLRPRRLVDDQFWPIVCAAEGLGGGAALRRSAELAAAVRPLARTALVRHCSPAWLSALIYPAIFSLIDRQALEELARALATGSTLGWLILLYPVLMSGLYMGYGPSRVLLYWTARQCLGEAEPPELPEVGRQRRARPRPALSTIAWWGLPLLLFTLSGVGLYHLARPSLADELTLAIREGRGRAAQQLLDRGAPVDGADDGGATPLIEAVVAGTPAGAELLLGRGAPLDARDRRGATALRHAVARGQPEIARLLLARGADANIADEAGSTPLMVAARRGDAALVRALLERGADPARRDRDGHSAGDLARQEGHAEVAALLR